MTEIKIKIPEGLKSVLGEIDEPLYLETLRKIAIKKYKLKKKKYYQLQKRIKVFESRYNLTLEEFSKKLPDTKKAHDEWLEWTFLSESLKELKANLLKLERIIGK